MKTIFELDMIVGGEAAECCDMAAEFLAPEELDENGFPLIRPPLDMINPFSVDLLAAE